MDAGLAVGLAMALAAAFLFNYSYMLQHGALDGIPEIQMRHPLQTLRSLFGHRAWFFGTVAGVVGFALNAGALALAPLSLVQAFLASGLAFAVPMSVRMAGHHLTRRDSVGVTVMTTALILLAVGTGEHTSTNSFDPWVLGTVTAASVIAALLLSALVKGDRRAEALALAGGLFFGISDALVNALVGILGSGVIDFLISPWLWICVATNIAAFFNWQQSLQVGRTKVLAVVVLMTAATNILAIAAGFAVFGDSLGASAAWKTVHLLCFAAIGVAMWMLAPAQAAITAQAELGQTGADEARA